MRVDVHTHFLPEPFRRLLRDWNERVRIEDRDGQPHAVHASGAIPLSPGFRDLDARAAWMDEHDVDVTVASASTPNPNEEPFSVAQSTELVRALNDGYAEAQRDYPDRFAGLGALPLRDPEAALTEVDRITDDLDLAGVAVHATVRGRKLSAPELEPVFERVAERDLPVFVHPGRNVLSHELEAEEGGLNPTVIFPTETTVQLTRLIFDGFFDRHDVDLVVAHMGGALPYLVGRLERGRERFRTAPDVPPERPVQAYVEEFYYDTISFHQPALRAAIETAGTDHLLFGTDYPFDMEDVDASLRDVRETSPSESATCAMMGETAADLFDL